MATRSTIAVELSDGTVQQVYAHWDGYLEYTGEILFNHYNTQEAAENLTKLGNISILRKNINPKGAHSFDSPEKDVTVYYGRDRGEEGQEPTKFRNIDMYFLKLEDQEFNYIFTKGQWFLSMINSKKLVPLDLLLNA